MKTAHAEFVNHISTKWALYKFISIGFFYLFDLFLSGNRIVEVDKPFFLPILLFYIFCIACMMFFNLSTENKELIIIIIISSSIFQHLPQNPCCTQQNLFFVVNLSRHQSPSFKPLYDFLNDWTHCTYCSRKKPWLSGFSTST